MHTHTHARAHPHTHVHMYLVVALTRWGCFSWAVLVRKWPTISTIQIPEAHPAAAEPVLAIPMHPDVGYINLPRGLSHARHSDGDSVQSTV